MRPMLSLMMGLLALSASLWLLTNQRSCSGAVAMQAPGAPAETVR